MSPSAYRIMAGKASQELQIGPVEITTLEGQGSITGTVLHMIVDESTAEELSSLGSDGSAGDSVGIVSDGKHDLVIDGNIIPSGSNPLIITHSALTKQKPPITITTR